MVARKGEVVSAATAGIDFLMKKNLSMFTMVGLICDVKQYK